MSTQTIRPVLSDADAIADLHGKPRTLSYRVRRALMVPILAVLAFLAGCATDMSKYYEVQGKAIEADNNAVMALAAAAAQGNQGAIVALALRQGQAGKIAPPQDKALAWASVLLPTVTNLYSIQQGTRVNLANIEAETSRYGLTMGTVSGIASQGIEAASKPPVIVSTQPTGSSVIFPVAE